MSEDIADRAAVRSHIDAILLGGPAGIPADERSRTVGIDEVKVKLPYLDGYEHFEWRPSTDREVDGPVTFRWTMRTRIAE